MRVCIGAGRKLKVQNQSYFMQEKNLLATINNTTFNVDHSRWGRARDAHNSRIMDQRSNNNNDRMMFGSL